MIGFMTIFENAFAMISLAGNRAFWMIPAGQKYYGLNA